MVASSAIKSAHRVRRWWPLIALCAFALTLMWRPVLRGEVFLPIDALMHLHPWRYSYERVPVNNAVNTDPIKQVYPRRVWTDEIIKQGAWPLWNPTVLTGTPNLPDGQVGLFYPPTWLFLLIPLAQAFGWYAYFHVILAGVGAYCFVRRLKLDQVSAVLASVVYMFNGYLITWLYFPHHTGATALLPWCFVAIERAITQPRWGKWAQAAIMFALPLLIHIQLAFYIYIGMGCYVLVRALQSHTWRARWQIVARFSAAMMLALALSAVQMLPAFDMAAQGQRGDLGFEAASAQDQFLNVLQLGLPTLGGAPRSDTPPSWGPELLRTPMPYIGIIPLLLVLIGLWFARHPASFGFGLFGILAFALAINSPLLQLFMAFVPLYRQFEDHTRWFVLWYFAAAVLAALGAGALLQHDQALSANEQKWRLANRALLIVTALGLLAWALWHLQLFTPQSRYGFYITLIHQQQLALPIVLFTVAVIGLALLAWSRSPVLRTAVLGILVAVTVFDLVWYGGSFNTSVDQASLQPTSDLIEGLKDYPALPSNSDTIYPPTRQMAFLLSQPGPFRILGGNYTALAPNLASAYGLEDLRGYQSLYFERFNRLARLVDGKDYSHTGSGNVALRAYFSSAYKHRRLLDMLNVAYVLFEPKSVDPQLFAPLELVQDTDEGQVYRNPTVLPRAWLVHIAAIIPDDDGQLNLLASANFDPATQVILPTTPPALAASSTVDPVPTISYAPNRATVHANPSAAAILVVSDAYSDDWQVSVDGQPATLYRANYAFRGVWLAAGEHTIEFVYRPRAFYIGGAISLTAVLGLALAGLGSLFSAKQQKQ